MDRGLDPCRSGKIIRMPFEPFRHSLDLALKTSVFPTNNRGSFVVFHRCEKWDSNVPTFLTEDSFESVHKGRRFVIRGLW